MEVIEMLQVLLGKKRVNTMVKVLLVLLVVVCAISGFPLNDTQKAYAQGDSWLTGYAYRQQMVINSTTNGTQAVYQMPLNVYKGNGTSSNDTVYLQSHALSWTGAVPNDIRFTKGDGNTQLDYYIESSNATDAVVWVRFLDIPESGSIDFYVYYGRAYDATTSNGIATFPILFDEFETANDAIVSNVGHSAMDVSLWGPSATYYNNKTYFVVADMVNLDPFAMTYDHTTKTISALVRAGTSPITYDSHGNPAILRDSNGYLHIFYGCHDSYMHYARSTNPDDISAWGTTDVHIGDASASYPHPILMDNGDIYVFYRRSWEVGPNWFTTIAYIKSTDGGINWDASVDVVDRDSLTNCLFYLGAITHQPGVNERVHLAWSYYITPGGVPYSFYGTYYAYFDPSDGHAYAADDTDLGACVSLAEMDASCQAYSNDSIKNVYVREYGGVPYIIFNHDTTFKFVKWTGANWTAPQTITTTTNYSYYHDFIVHSATDIEAYFDVGNRIERWDWDGTNWSQIAIIADGANYTYGVSSPAIVNNYNNDIKLVFSQIYVSSGLPYLGFAYGDSGFIRSGTFNGEIRDIWTQAGIPTADATHAYSDGYSCKIPPTPASGRSVITAALAPSGNITIRMRFYKTDAVDSIFPLLHGNATYATYVWFTADEHIHYYDTSDHDTGVAIAADAWCLLELRNFDWTAHTYDIIYNGGIVQAGAGLRAITSYNGVLKIQGDDTYPAEICWVDDVLVRQWADPEPTWGAWGSEEYPPATSPTVVTGVATSIGDTTATLNGDITDTGGENSTVLMYWGLADGGNTSASWSNNSTPTSPSQPQGVAAFSYNTTGLSPGVLYYFNASANNSGGTGWGASQNFTTTISVAPTVTTLITTNITTITAIGNGNITDIGSDNCTYRGIEWGIYSGNYTSNVTDFNASGFGTGMFTKEMVGLTDSTTYYHRAIAYSSAGWGYGEEMFFNTLVAPAAPSIVAIDASSITSDSAVLGGNITSIHGGNVTSRGVQWGVSTGNYTASWSENSTFGIGAFNHLVTGLSDNTTYYFCSFATNIYGTTNSSELTFTTPTLVLWYQPVTIIGGTTLPDRETTTVNDGIITWGANSTNISVSVGALTGGGGVTLPSGPTSFTADLVPTTDTTSKYPTAGAVPANLLASPLHQLTSAAATVTTFTEMQIWIQFASLLILVAVVLSLLLFQSHQFISGVVGLIGTGLTISVNIYPPWAIIIAVTFLIATLVMERTTGL